MNDRVVDRAAAHATPAELAIRDWLLVALSLATGIYEAICFLTFVKTFPKVRKQITLMALSALALGLQANAIRSPYPASRSRTVRGCRPSRSRRSGSTPAKRPSRAAW
jgi:hypothetical protein